MEKKIPYILKQPILGQIINFLDEIPLEETL
jgi:hypothetical protein